MRWSVGTYVTVAIFYTIQKFSTLLSCSQMNVKIMNTFLKWWSITFKRWCPIPQKAMSNPKGNCSTLKKAMPTPQNVMSHSPKSAATPTNGDAPSHLTCILICHRMKEAVTDARLARSNPVILWTGDANHGNRHRGKKRWRFGHCHSNNGLPDQ